MRRGIWLGVWLGLMGCGDVSPPMGTQTPPIQLTPHATGALSMADVEVFIGQKLPASATQVEFATQSGIDTLYYLQFDANPSDVQDFVASLGADLRPGMNPFPASVEDVPAWWGAATAQNGVGDSFIGQNGRGYEMMVEERSPQSHRVFLRVFDL